MLHFSSGSKPKPGKGRPKSRSFSRGAVSTVEGRTRERSPGLPSVRTDILYSIPSPTMAHGRRTSPVGRRSPHRGRRSSSSFLPDVQHLPMLASETPVDR